MLAHAKVAVLLGLCFKLGAVAISPRREVRANVPVSLFGCPAVFLSPSVGVSVVA